MPESRVAEADAAAFADRWTRAIAGTSYVPMETDETAARLRLLARRLLAAWYSDPVRSDLAFAVGAELVDSHFTNPDTISRTVALLAQLPAQQGPDHDGRALGRIGAVQGALAAGYATRLQERTFAEQDAIRSAATTAQDEAERAARASEARFQAVFAGAAIGIGLGDTGGTILDANPALTKMLGYSVHEMRSRNVSDFMHPEDTQKVWALYEQLIRGDRESFQTAKQFRRKDGRRVWTHLTVSLIRDQQGRPEFQIAVIEDVTDLRRLQDQLEYQAHHDKLTGLYNRAVLQARIDQLVGESGRGRRLGICLLDLDGFKMINDSVGHEVGDQVLVGVARRLEAAIGGDGRMVARWGGDEFVILLHDTSGAGDVIEVAERALKAVEQPVAVAGRTYTVTASAGLVERAARFADTADLLRAADITLYWAKDEGKDRWALFDSERSDRDVAQYTLARMLPEALRNNEFRLHYQPLFDLAGGRPSGVEALLRWKHPRFGQLLPGRFIDAAEETGIIVPLGRWVLEAACRQARDWAHRYVEKLQISVNIAMRQLADRQLVGDVVAVLAENELAPSQLQLELTERAVIGTDREPLAVLRALADIGVRIAIDDFGTGYSNMTYLRRLPVSELKLAGSFIDELRPGDPRTRTIDAQIVGSLVSLAHTLGMTVTAEGVETGEQAQALRDLGCDRAQGTFFGSPGPPLQVQQQLDDQLRHAVDAAD